MDHQIQERNNTMAIYLKELIINDKFTLGFKCKEPDFFAANIIFFPEKGSGYSQSTIGTLIGYYDRTKYPEGPLTHWSVSIYFYDHSSSLNDEKIAKLIIEALRAEELVAEPIELSGSMVSFNYYNVPKDEPKIGYYLTYGDLGLD